MPRSALALLITVACCGVALRHALADPVNGVIRGAKAVNVRRGPGTESPAFTYIAKGTRVTVEAIDGQWARIVLQNGERGFVNAAYVDLPPGVTADSAAEPAPTAEASPPADLEPAMPTSVEATRSVHDELAQMRQRLAALESSVATPVGALAGGIATPTPTPTPEAEPPPPTPVALLAPVSLDVGPVLALAGVCLVVGFIAGTLYGQRQERGRRYRVRF